MTTTARTPIAPQRGTFQPIARPRTSTVPAHYLQLRRMKITEVHQQDLNRFAGEMRETYGGDEKAMLAYFANFKRQVDISQASYDTRKEEIMSDPAATLMEKHKSLERVGQPMMPSWSQASENAYLRTYGDPRTNPILWDQALSNLMQPEVPMMKNMRNVIYTRTPWEMFVIKRLLADPSIDGSVAPCNLIGQINDQRSHPAAVTRSLFVPPATGTLVDGNPEYLKAMVKAAEGVCPHCYEHFPRGLPQHEPACARRHETESVIRALPKMSDTQGAGAQDDEAPNGGESDEQDETSEDGAGRQEGGSQQQE